MRHDLFFALRSFWTRSGILFARRPKIVPTEFLKAVRWHSPHGAPVIESRGRRFLCRDVADTLRGLGFDFDQQRLIREFREKTGLPQPTRYGRRHVPVFELGEGMLEVA